MLVTEILRKTLWKTKSKWKLKAFIFIELRLSKYISKRGRIALAWKQAKITAKSPFHFHWIATFRKKCESKGKLTVESPFHFIELRLSKYVSKRGRLAFSLNKQKWQLKVLFISLNCDFQKRSPKGPGWLGLWKQIQNYSWKSFSFSLNCDFQKKVWKQSQNDVWKFFSFSLNCNFQKRSLNQGQSDLDFESKTKMTAESPFHFIELRLSNKIITTGAADLSFESMAKSQLKVLFTSLDCDFA